MEMPSFKKIILLIVIVISFYIIYRLIVRRQTLLAINPLEKTLEELIENFQETMPTIRNTNNLSLPIKEYLCFSSWNSCVTSGNNVSLSQLEKVIQNGCRFLDFEVYNISGTPEIGYSSSGYVAGQELPELETDTIPFIDICNKIVSTPSPNSNDPLFIHLRIKSNNIEILEKMAESLVSSGIENRLYDKNVNENTLLSELQNHYVLVIDNTYVPNIDKVACPKGCKTDIRYMINMFSGTNEMSSIKLSHQLQQDVRPLQKKDENNTNVSKLKLVTHDVGTHHQTKNSDEWKKLIMDYKIQIIPFKFYYNDDALHEYKNFFSEYGHRAFIPMAVTHDALIHS